MTQQERWVTSRYTSDDAQDCLQLLRAASGETGAADSSHHEWQCQRSPAGAAIGSLAREAETGRLIDYRDCGALDLAYTDEEAERLGGSYRLSDLKREEAPGSVSDLAALLSQTSNIWVNAEFDANIYGRDAVPASRIFYRVGLEPVSNENESEL